MLIAHGLKAMHAILHWLESRQVNHIGKLNHEDVFCSYWGQSAHKVVLRFLQLGMFTKSVARKLVTTCTKISANEYVLPNQLP